RLVKGVRGHAAGRAQNDDIAVVLFGRVEHAGQLTGTSLTAPRLFESPSGVIKAEGSGLIRLDQPDGPGILRPRT
ncbi:MAG: hypothetical protein ACRC7O_18385, partial [Fimbriiglobus sp.]